MQQLRPELLGRIRVLQATLRGEHGMPSTGQVGANPMDAAAGTGVPVWSCTTYNLQVPKDWRSSCGQATH